MVLGARGDQRESHVWRENEDMLPGGKDAYIYKSKRSLHNCETFFAYECWEQGVVWRMVDKRFLY